MMSRFHNQNEWNCLYLVVRWLVVIVDACSCLFAVAMMYMSRLGLGFGIYWQCWLEMMALDLCHVVFDGVVFIAPCIGVWGVNDVL